MKADLPKPENLQPWQRYIWDAIKSGKRFTLRPHCPRGKSHVPTMVPKGGGISAHQIIIDEVPDEG